MPIQHVEIHPPSLLTLRRNQGAAHEKRPFPVWLWHGTLPAESGMAAYPPSRWRPAGGQLRYPHRGRGRRKNIKAVADDSARRLAGLKLQFDLKSEGVVRGGIRQAKQPGRVVADGLSGPS
jgi:hypothetical protein